MIQPRSTPPAPIHRSLPFDPARRDPILTPPPGCYPIAGLGSIGRRLA